MTQQLLKDLARAKATFQLRAIETVMGLPHCQHCDEQHEDGAVFCPTCGDHHEPDCVPYECETGDGI